MYMFYVQQWLILESTSEKYASSEEILIKISHSNRYMIAIQLRVGLEKINDDIEFIFS